MKQYLVESSEGLYKLKIDCWTWLWHNTFSDGVNLFFFIPKNQSENIVQTQSNHPFDFTNCKVYTSVVGFRDLVVISITAGEIYELGFPGSILEKMLFYFNGKNWELSAEEKVKFHIELLNLIDAFPGDTINLPDDFMIFDKMLLN